MKKSDHRRSRGEASTLTLRLWEFTGTALLNLLIWIAIVVYLSPLTYMLVTSLKSSDQLLEYQCSNLAWQGGEIHIPGGRRLCL